MKREELNSPYSEGFFLKLNSAVVDADFKKSELSELNTRTLKYIKHAKYMGSFEGLNIHVFSVMHESSKDARVGVGLEIFKIMKNNNFQNSIVASYNESENEWRYSFVTSSLEIDEKGKIKKNFSSPKRYSYILGPKAKTLTPYNFLLKKSESNSLDQIKKKFSVEVVNNEFYTKIATLYDELVGTEKQTRLLKYPNTDEQSHEFAVRLIGRIIFCWFLKEKKRPDNTPLIPDEILSSEATNKKNYYHSVLAPLFFEVLNKRAEHRSSKYSVGHFQKIPYLNGGLFKPAEEIDYYKFDNELEVSVSGIVDIPDMWLLKFIELLEMYNFTVDENTSYDNDLSIDPEMLGRVFENLLARINPETGHTVRNSTGSFYTPREIVDYMVDTSIKHYLVGKTEIAETKLEALISYDLLDDIGNQLNKDEANFVLEALSELKVLDPACGSGAYPMGVLQKIMHIVNVLDPKGEWWLNKQLGNASPELRRELEGKSINYVRKLNIINKTIFGVDIQPIATEISRLRCFLTLVVDEEISESDVNQGIRPLPNLDFKFVTADTLSLPPRQEDDRGPRLLESFEDELEDLVSSYFSAQGEERANLSHRLRDLIAKKVRENNMAVFGNRGIIKDERFHEAFNDKKMDINNRLIQEAAIWESYNNIFNYKKVDFFDTKYFFPQAKSGFDIVIGNPPYIQLQKDGGLLGNKYKNYGYETFAKTGDIYSLFYERGLRLAKEGSGLLCYITSNKWMKAGYGKPLRSFLASKQPMELIDLGGDVFETATVDTNILLVKNSGNICPLRALDLSNVKNIPSFNYYKNRWVELANLGPDTWTVCTPQELALKNKIEKLGKPLKNWDVKIYRGILTGLNEAFIIDQETKNKLIKEDPKSEEIIKPILRGRDIKKYGYNFEHIYLITTHNGYQGIPPIQIDDYPAIKSYLETFEPKLSKRGDKGSTPYHLRDCAYMGEFAKEKVVWGNISYESRFSYSPDELMINAPANILTSDTESIKYLVACMNSSIFNWEFSSTGIDLGKAFEWKKQYVEQIHIPSYYGKEDIKLKIENIVEQIFIKTQEEADTTDLEAQIDELVYKLYELTQEEIEIIEESTK